MARDDFVSRSRSLAALSLATMKTALSCWSLALAALATACGTRVTAFSLDDASADRAVADSASVDAPLGDAAVDSARDVVRRDAAPLGPMDMVVTTVSTEIGCARDEWCWESPLPQGEAAFASFAFSENDQWIFGGAGMALRYDGTRWTRVRTGTRANIVGAWGSAPNDLWVAGYRSASGGDVVERVLLRWNGVAFSPAPPLPMGMQPRFVHGSSANNVWAVASAASSLDARVFRFDGTAWTEISTGLASVNPSGLWVESPTRAWITGEANGPSRSGAWRFDGTQWSFVGDLSTLGYRGFRSGPVVYDGSVFAIVAATSGGLDGIVRITEGGYFVEQSPTRMLSYQSSLTVGGGSLWLLPGSGSGASSTVYRRRSLATGWTSASIPAGEHFRAPTVMVSGSAAGAWMSNVYADLYRLRDGSGAGTITLESPAARPRTMRFAGRRSAPSAAVTLSNSLLVRDARTAQWTVGAPYSAPLTHAEYLSDGTLAFGIIGAQVQRFAGNMPVGAAYGRDVASVFARSANDAIAVVGQRVERWDGAQWTALPSIPPMVGMLPTRNIRQGSIWRDDQDVFVGGGVPLVELEGDSLGVLCRYRDSEVFCVNAPTIRDGGPSNVNGLVRGEDGALYTLLGSSFSGGALYRIDRETLAFAAVTFDGASRTWSYLAGNESTGELVLSDGDVTVVHPRAQRAERYPVPVSGYASHARDVHIGDDGALWLLRENTEVLRLTPSLR